MCECITKPINEIYSGCLVENPSCKFAFRFGFSYLCEHPQHKDFYPNNFPSKHHLDHNKLYEDLKESRRNEYISKAKKYLEDLEYGKH
jgi:hypothetical protein